ncbi:Heme exporter protein C [Roseomonas sp. TAS13]|uniref:Heme exporter protein C n=1 Tax=Roseomonas mucosa TaxID=207340 RepID=A0A1S8D4I2_9PROT|nr:MULTISPECIES: heme ABC transporter permease [Roseomonas]ONH82498.1 heme transporter [Roseomonas mucosa]USQ73122.1 heme ABC transporter permease [Roseomonas mucosa]GAV35279.1 Heme exporter protein C [Roseomonas sp. TAS13]
MSASSAPTPAPAQAPAPASAPAPLPARRAAGWHRFAQPGRFLRLTERATPVLWALAALVLAIGVPWALVFSPPDWQQGETVRIMYVHVPMAWLAMSGYATLALASLSGLVWRHPLADIVAREISPVGAAVTGLCLLTGSLWGKPMWGTWWVWDARLTSVLVLFFFWVGHAALVRAFEEEERGARMGAILALVGAVNLPIVKFSVDWWNTLHQPASVARLGAPGLHVDLLYPLLANALGFTLLFVAIVLTRSRAAILERRVRALSLARARRLDGEMV